MHIADLVDKILETDEAEPEFLKRLRLERAESEPDHRALGVIDALGWAVQAPYKKLKYAAEEFDPVQPTVKALENNLRADTILAPVFEPVLSNKTVDHEKWITGWRDAVKVFWAQVEPLLSFQAGGALPEMPTEHL